MTATLHNIFDTPDTDSLAAAAREADLAVWWDQQLYNARVAMALPELYSDDELRDACATLQSRWGDATDYCMADAMIWKLDERDRMRRHADAKAETSRDVFWGMRDRFGEIAAWVFGTVVAVAVAKWGVWF